MLDAESAQARTSLAHAKSRAQWSWHEAELEFQRAIRLDPGYATSHHWYARCCLVPMGRLDEAREAVLLAQSLDPVSSIIATISIRLRSRSSHSANASCTASSSWLNRPLSIARFTSARWSGALRSHGLLR